MGRFGQIINTTQSGGRTVAGMWCFLFQENERAFAAKCWRLVRTDAELTAAMLAAFPDRGESVIFRQVNRVRNRYNRGELAGQNGVRPAVRSHRYVRQIDGKTVRFFGRAVQNKKVA